MILGAMTPMWRRLPSRACGIALLALGATASAATSESGPFELQVPARGFEERCVQLAAGQRMHYRFRADGDVDFNLHFHRGAEVHYPVKRAATRAEQGEYTAPHADGYCLMWERRGDGAVRVEGKLEVDAAAQPPR